MDRQRRKYIGSLADQIRSALALGDLPVDVEAAVQRLGGKLDRGNNAGAEALIRKTGDGFVIRL